MNEILKQKIEAAAVKYFSTESHGVIDSFIAGAEFLSGLEEWISVNDRLPDHTNKVLVLFKHVDNVLMGRYFLDNSWKVFFSDGEKFLSAINPDAELITHWKEIQPPKTTP